MTAATGVIRAATCLGCGCACDDIEVVVNRSSIVETRNTCPLGARWFGTGASPARARVDGHDVALTEAVEQAAQILSDAACPHVLLGPDVSCDTYAEAVAFADTLRARIDLLAPESITATVLATQERGITSATLGEIRNRADVLLFWALDPAVNYPRYLSRYAPEPRGVHVPHGRASRTVIAVDIDGAHGPADADIRVNIRKSAEVDTLVALAALLEGSTPPRHDIRSHIAWDTVSTLAGLLGKGRYVVIVADGESAHDRNGHGRIHRLLALGQAVNSTSRGALSLLGGTGNLGGAAAVLTRQTGYPGAIDFSSGAPRYRPHTGARGLAHDAVLFVGSAARIRTADIEALDRAPSIVIGPHASESTFRHARVLIDCATAGIHAAGMAVRMDEVPIPLKQIISGPPDATAICRDLRHHLQRVRA